MGGPTESGLGGERRAGDGRLVVRQEKCSKAAAMAAFVVCADLTSLRQVPILVLCISARLCLPKKCSAKQIDIRRLSSSFVLHSALR
jgi:hypothetical protein